jgi:hypothetical protein
MHLDSETIDLYAAGYRSPEAADHLDGCAECRRRLRQIEDLRAYFVERVLPRSWQRLSGAVAYDGRH